MDTKELLYYNGFGGFLKDGKEYIIKTNEEYTPLPWSHMMANPEFGTIITSDGGGYTWSHNSRENKITTWTNDPVGDKASEKLWIEEKAEAGLKAEDKENAEGMIGLLPYDTLSGFEIHFGFGYAIFKRKTESLKTEVTMYVPLSENKKVVRVSVENLTDSAKHYQTCYLAEMVLGVDKEYTRKHLVFENVSQGLKVENHYRESYANEFVYLLGMANSDSFEINSMVDDEKNGTVQVSFLLLPHQKADIFFELKVSSHGQEEINQSNANVLRELEEIKEYWEKLLGNIKVKTPVESMNIMMNGWLGYQTVVSRLWGRTSFYQAGGAFGFRDQLQDSLIMLYLDPSFARKQILYHAAHEFKAGDVLHWWHPEKNNGIRTRYTDDLLWLPYLICEYLEKTGDDSILEEQVPYVEMEELRDDEGERYSEVSISKETESLYLHAIRAIEKSLHFGENGLAEMGTGDWNDGMNKINGQSVWLTFFMADVISKFIKVCEHKKDREKVVKYQEILANLKEVVNTVAWDGNWYKRAFFKDGTPLRFK